MSAANLSPSDIFASLDERNDWLELLPKLLTFPGGVLYTNLLIFRAIRNTRKTIERMRNFMRDSRFGADPVEYRKEFADLMAQVVKDKKSNLAQLERLNHHGIILRTLVASYAKTVDEYSDLAETAALAADAEMDTLANQLKNAL